MESQISGVMNERLVDLLNCWDRAFAATRSIDDPLGIFAAHRDNLLIIETDGPRSLYRHYGRSFSDQFGKDLTGMVIDLLPSDILPSDQRGMLAFEYNFARQVARPLWRSYTALFDDREIQTWQRLTLPIGHNRLAVGVYRSFSPPAAGSGDALTDLVGLLIDRVPVVVNARGQIEDLALSLTSFCSTQQQAAELEMLASRDELTGVANLRHFKHLANLEIDHARRMGRAFAVMMLDIDHFKKINDNWGHATGDAALKAFVGACRVMLREPDMLGRCGGEEFGVVLPNTGADGARIIAEKLREQVEATSVTAAPGKSLRFTVSIGIAVASAEGQGDSYPTIAQLMAAADIALYRSKAEGRNRVSVATPDDLHQAAGAVAAIESSQLAATNLAFC